MKRFMQKLEKSNGKYSNAQSLHQKYLKIARYSCAIFNTNLAHCCISEPNILNRTQVNKYLEKRCDSGNDSPERPHSPGVFNPTESINF